MPLDETEGTLQLIDEHGTDHKRDAEAQRVAQKHQDALHHAALLRSEHQRGAQKSAYAGRPANGKYKAEQHSGEEAHVFMGTAAAHSTEEVQLEHVEEIQAEEDHDEAGHDVDGRLIRAQQPADGAGQRAHQHENQREAEHEAQRVFQGFPYGTRAAARKIRDVNRQHGQKAGGNEGDDAFEKRDKIGHGIPFRVNQLVWFESQSMAVPAYTAAPTGRTDSSNCTCGWCNGWVYPCSGCPAASASIMDGTRWLT